MKGTIYMKRTDERYEVREYRSAPVGHKKKRGTNIIIVLCVAASVFSGGVLGYTLAGGFDEAETVDVAANSDNAETTLAPTSVPVSNTEKADNKQYNIPPASEVTDLIDVIAAARLEGMSKRCYLTFDDGPSQHVTGEILDTLGKYDIKATFFEVGKKIDEFPDITKRAYDEGHLIANHSYSHDYNALYATEESFKSEIEHAEESIKSATGQRSVFKLIRFPGGSYNAGDHAAEKQVYKNTLADMGYYYCDWNSLNGDAEGTEKNAAQLIEFFKNGAVEFISQNKNLIVLMHDSDAKQATADALESIILYMKDYGYTFHRLDDISVD